MEERGRRCGEGSVGDVVEMRGEKGSGSEGEKRGKTGVEKGFMRRKRRTKEKERERGWSHGREKENA